MTILVRSRATCLVAALIVCGLVGCSKNNGKKPKTRVVEGVAKVIDLENNHVSMVTKDDKGNEIELTGMVREDTEVWINGRSQNLRDIRPGDKVVVTGYSEGEGDSKQLIATRVEVTRPQGSDWKATAKPVAKETELAVKKPAPKTVAPAKSEAVITTASQADPAPVAADEEQLRAQATDMVYAQIRIKMEEAIEKRAALLKAGTERSDPQVREQEGVIMRARDLLIEAGEVVEELDPPIIETKPVPPVEQP